MGFLKLLFSKRKCISLKRIAISIIIIACVLLLVRFNEELPNVTKYSNSSGYNKVTNITIKNVLPDTRGDHTNSATKPDARGEHAVSAANTSSPPLVLVLTYMRSGSSMTGDILQQQPNAFYVFEPLRFFDSMHDFYPRNFSLLRDLNIEKEMRTLLRSWFTCDIDALYTPHLLRMFKFLSLGIKTDEYLQCIIEDFGYKVQSIVKCFALLKRLCRDSSVRILKTIRLSFDSVYVLLKELPNLHIIHLIRDPRATLFSHAKFGECQKKNKAEFENCTQKLCTRIKNDLQISNTVQQMYPHRKIRTITYEELSRNPIETSRMLYEFIGLKFTDDIRDYVHEITHTEGADKCRGICVTSSNSSEHVDYWKLKMPIKYIDDVQANKNCQYVMQVLNYSRVDTRNMSMVERVRLGKNGQMINFT